MPFSLLPALDLTGGRLGVWTAEAPVPTDAFGGDPDAAAASAIEQGATWLHVVDMDLAFGGEPANLDVIARLADSGASIQASGRPVSW